MLEYKSFPAEINEVKAEDLDAMEFEGYAATFTDIPDSYNEVIKKGAFKKTIRERFKKSVGSLIKVLYGHREIIGLPIEMKEDDVGLYTRSKVSETSLGLDTMTLIRDGALDRMSIGFNTIKYDQDNDTGIRTLKEIKLYEYSPVPFPANESALITGSKAIALLQDSEVLETLKLLGDPAIKEALELLARKDIITDIEDENEDVILPSNNNDEEKILNAISAMRATANALELRLNPKPEDSTRNSEPGNSTSTEPDDATMDLSDEVDPAFLQTMLDEMKGLNQELQPN